MQKLHLRHPQEGPQTFCSQLKFLGKLTSFIQYCLQMILKTYEETIPSIPGSIFCLFVILIFYCRLHDRLNSSPALFLCFHLHISPQTATQCLKPPDSTFLFVLAVRKLTAKSGAPAVVKTSFHLNLVFPPCIFLSPRFLQLFIFYFQMCRK